MSDEPRIRIDASNLRARVGDTDYEWSGGFGGILHSREWGMQTGDTRMIGGVVFYVYMSYRHDRCFWEPPTVCWTVADPQIEWIRQFKEALFR